MEDPGKASYSFLLETDRAEMVPIVEEALRSAGIPYQSGLQSAPSPRVIFSVPKARLDEARGVVAQYFETGPLASGDEAEPEALEEEPRFPWGPIRATLIVVLFHLALVFGLVGPDPTSSRLASLGGLVGGVGLTQPWRLATYVFLHVDPKHALWNGLSMLVFTVPLVGSLGYLRTAAIYLMSGILGGVAALAIYPPGTVTIGSSGAVAGLFGAWLVLTLHRTRQAPPTTRARLKVMGVTLLFLPALLTPTTSGGHSISVASHLGGLAAGVAMAPFLAARRRAPLPLDRGEGSP